MWPQCSKKPKNDQKVTKNWPKSGQKVNNVDHVVYEHPLLFFGIKWC